MPGETKGMDPSGAIKQPSDTGILQDVSGINGLSLSHWFSRQ